MKPITLNLASRPFRNNATVGALLAGASLALVLATGYNLYAYLIYGSSFAQLQQGQQQERARLKAFEAEERTLLKEVQQRDFRKAYERGKYANDLILKRSFSWTLLFNTLETVIPPDVMMRSIRPNITAEGISVRVEGIAKGNAALLSLEDRLIHHPAFAKVYPVNERHLNPNRPEIDFALRYDYLPQKAASKDLVAKDSAGAGTAKGAEPVSAPPPDVTPSDAPVSAAAPLPAAQASTASAPASASPAPGPGAPAVVSAASGPEGKPGSGGPAAAPAPKAPERPPFDLAAALASVGRDGRPRTQETLARLLVAPGGVYLPAGQAGHAEKENAGRKGSKTGGPGGVPRAGHGNAEGTAGQADGAGGAGASKGGRVGAKGSATGTPAAAAIVAPRPRPVARVPGAAGLAHAERPPVPAQRLDIPMSFVARPVGEVYRSLARAHGVTFDIDPGVDQTKTVTANLGGKDLTQAVLIVAGLAGHRVRRKADGVYRIAVGSGATSITEPAVGEEDLRPPGEAP